MSNAASDKHQRRILRVHHSAHMVIYVGCGCMYLSQNTPGWPGLVDNILFESVSCCEPVILYTCIFIESFDVNLIEVSGTALLYDVRIYLYTSTHAHAEECLFVNSNGSSNNKATIKQQKTSAGIVISIPIYIKCRTWPHYMYTCKRCCSHSPVSSTSGSEKKHGSNNNWTEHKLLTYFAANLA